MRWFRSRTSRFAAQRRPTPRDRLRASHSGRLTGRETQHLVRAAPSGGSGDRRSPPPGIRSVAPRPPSALPPKRYPTRPKAAPGWRAGYPSVGIVLGPRQHRFEARQHTLGPCRDKFGPCRHRFGAPQRRAAQARSEWQAAMDRRSWCPRRPLRRSMPRRKTPMALDPIPRSAAGAMMARLGGPPRRSCPAAPDKAKGHNLRAWWNTPVDGHLPAAGNLPVDGRLPAAGNLQVGGNRPVAGNWRACGATATRFRT